MTRQQLDLIRRTLDVRFPVYVIITKSDLLPHLTFDLEAVREQVTTLNGAGVFLLTSSTTGEGIEAWCDLLALRLSDKRNPSNRDS